MHKITLDITLVGFVAFTLVACTGRQDTALTLRKGVVERGSIDQTVSATGSIFPEERVSLRFEQPGIAQEVYVEVGDYVAAGQPLISLDSEHAALAARQAEIGLLVQELSYERLFLPPSDAQLLAARAAIDSAQATYDKLAEGGDPEALRIAQLQYEQAFNAYIQADMELRGAQSSLPEYLLVPMRERVKQALLNVEVARLRLEQLRTDPDQYALAVAQSDVARAQAELQRLLEGPTDLEIAQGQARITQAQLTLERTLRNLELATLVAPFSGIVVTVNARVGQLTPSNLPTIEIMDTSRLHVEVDVDEIDIGQVAIGQPVMVTLDALPAETLQGQVTDIAPAATLEQGIVTYLVRIDLVSTRLPLKPGMTATADIIVQHLEGVLVVPNWAVRIDHTSGQSYASIMVGEDAVREVPVVLGLRGMIFSQVIAGLNEGQIVAVSLAREGIDIFGEEEP